MPYRIAEGLLTLDGEWQDQSINVLLPTDSPVTGVNLVVARDRLAHGMAFADYVAQQRQNVRNQLAGIDVMADTAASVDGREAHILEYSWQSDGKPVHQLLAMVLQDRTALLNFTGSIPGTVDAEIRQRLVAAITTFKFGV